MSNRVYYNNFGEYRIGDVIGISTQVGDHDSFHQWFEGDPPSAILTNARGTLQPDGRYRLTRVGVTSHSGKDETDRVEWAIKQLTGLTGCAGCRFQCKSDNECSLKQGWDEKDV